MCCELSIPCNVDSYPVYTAPECFLCYIQRGGSRTLSCGTIWPAGETYGKPTADWRGHGTQVWLMKHVEDPESDLPAALIQAKEWFGGCYPAEGGRGHFTLKDYQGHWALERFLAAKTVPFALSNAMVAITDDAVRWFFDPSKMLDDPAPLHREIGAEEIKRRLEAYQSFIDKETRRPWNQQNFEVLPPLTELPPEQQRRLVGWWERLHFDFLDMHPDWRWTPQMGFWKTGERIFPLV